MTALPPGESRERSFSWFDWSLLSDLSSDGKTILFSETGEAVGAHYGVYLRKTDETSAVRLGDGGFGSLSPDGTSVLVSDGSPAKLSILPIGVGQPRQLTDDKTEKLSFGWMPDGKSIFYATAEPGHGPRTYLLDVQGGPPRAVTPEGVIGFLATPDGKSFMAFDQHRQRWIYPVAGGEPQNITSKFTTDDRVIRFLDDGKSLLVGERGSIPFKVSRIDLSTGKREPWKDIVPADPAGVTFIPVVKFSADGKSYAYSVGRTLSDLFVVDGLK